MEQELLAKFELSNGILIYHQMATENHATIHTNLIREGSNLFIRQKRYKILGESFAITCPDLNSYYLPDASIVIGKEVEYVKVGKNKDKDAVSNAIAAIEILSPATEKYD
ncbi:MAG: Uma2 family endonuclease, partial [Bacteroidetes bacterium]